MQRRALVLAPLRVATSVWPAEVEKWAQFSHLKIAVLHGAKKEQALQQDADLYLINYEGLKWLVEGRRLEGLFKRGVDLLVADELSKLKHSSTARFKLLKPHLPRFRRRWGLTGSPATNGLMDLFGQAYVLDLGTALGRYVTHYRAKYFYQTGYGGYTWAPLPGSDKRIFKAAAPLFLRMAAKDYLTLPARTNNIIRVELPAQVRKLYDQMESQALIQLASMRVITATSASGAMSKCCQLINGAIYHTTGQEEGKGYELVHDVKAEALKDLVEELQGQPLLVGYEFKADIDVIRAALGPTTPYIGGGVTPAQGAALVQQWNAGRLPVLLGHPASMGHGLNMQGSDARHVCWYGVPWDLELYDQFIKRVLRQGNNAQRVFVHHIVATNTIDEVKMKVLTTKAQVQEALFKAIKGYRKC